jgi:ATP-dependent RNA helicase DHX37/DHR1
MSHDCLAQVFAPPPPHHRLVVIATNVAETSITIPHVRYVVDAGRAKERAVDVRSGISQFQTQWISKASADQRAGRAGRTGPGHCYRLYSSAVFEHECPAFALPRLLTEPMEDIVLQMKAMGITDVLAFPFPTPPSSAALASAHTLLTHLGAIFANASGHALTPLGKALAQFPLTPRFAKMLLVAKHVGTRSESRRDVLEYTIAMVAALSSGPSPFLLDEDRSADDADHEMPPPMQEQQQPQQQPRQEQPQHHQPHVHMAWMHTESDVLGMLRAAGAYAYSGGSAAFCHAHRLHEKVSNGYKNTHYVKPHDRDIDVYIYI